MATKSDFTEDEWRAMQKGVTGAGMLASISDPDFTDSFGEASALAKYLAEQRATNESQLVRELAGVHGSGFGLTTSRAKVEEETQGALQLAMKTLAAKAPDETEAYRQLVLGAAEHVASAKGGLKPGESAAIDRIREALT